MEVWLVYQTVWTGLRDFRFVVLVTRDEAKAEELVERMPEMRLEVERHEVEA